MLSGASIATSSTVTPGDFPYEDVV